MKSAKGPLLLAHRGTSVMAPENTAPAFDFAVHYGADILEIDVRLSGDGEVVVIHDESVDRTTNGTGKVAEQGLADLKRLDAAHRFDFTQAHKAFRSAACQQAVPKRLETAESNASHNSVHGDFDPYEFVRRVELLSLGELYSLYPYKDVNIDIKDNTESAADAVAREVCRYDAAGRTVIASFHDTVLQYCRNRYPWLKTSAGMSDVKQFYWWYLKGQKGPLPISVQLLQLPTRYFFISLSTQRFIDAVHGAGATVNYWTINHPSLMRRLIEKGADGIVTDRVDLARDILSRCP